MRVTLKDIADEAGVSLMTVSNVVNGRHARVSQTTVQRIREILDRRGYIPSASARSLAGNASRLVGLLVPSGEASVVLSPHNVAVFGILERELRERGYHLLFRGVGSIDEVDVALKTWNLDGAVLLEFRDAEIDAVVPPDGTPILALDSYSTNPVTTGVRSDDHEGGRLAAEHLLELGHRRILFASPGYTETGVVRERLDGFRDAHRALGLVWDEHDQEVVPTTYEAGVALAPMLRERHPEITAVFATADILAVGLLAGLQQAGRRVPDDISVIGYDGIEVGGYVTPQLSTVMQDVGAKAASAARILLAEIDGQSSPGEATVVPVRLLLRHTTGAAPRE